MADPTAVLSEGPLRSARTRVVETLRRELMGPYDGPNEQFSGEYPTSRYIVGRLAPIDQRVSDEEDDNLGAGEEEDEASETDDPLPLVLGFHTASIGLSFVLDHSCTHVDVHVTWGDYRREGAPSAHETPNDGSQDEGPASPNVEENSSIASERQPRSAAWVRYPREAWVRGLRIPESGRLPRTPLSQALLPSETKLEGFDAPDVVLEGVVHKVKTHRAVSLFLVNRRQKLELSDRRKDERWMLQVRLEIVPTNQKGAFLARSRDPGLEIEDPEAQSYELLYRDAREFASGHGVSVDWELDDDRSRARRIWSEFIPTSELPGLIAPSDIAGSALLDMKLLSECETAAQVVSGLNPLVESYEKWIEQQFSLLDRPPFDNDPSIKAVAEEHLQRCRTSATRMRKGLDILAGDADAFEAFRFTNRAMWDQRIHSLWAQSNRRNGRITGAPSSFDLSENRTWRSFQMGFILQCLAGIADPDKVGAVDRGIADLLWFPTAGGKTSRHSKTWSGAVQIMWSTHAGSRPSRMGSGSSQCGASRRSRTGGPRASYSDCIRCQSRRRPPITGYPATTTPG
jgi:hypothetical protein